MTRARTDARSSAVGSGVATGASGTTVSSSFPEESRAVRRHLPRIAVPPRCAPRRRCLPSSNPLERTLATLERLSSGSDSPLQRKRQRSGRARGLRPTPHDGHPISGGVRGHPPRARVLTSRSGAVFLGLATYGFAGCLRLDEERHSDLIVLFGVVLEHEARRPAHAARGRAGHSAGVARSGPATIMRAAQPRQQGR